MIPNLEISARELAQALQERAEDDLPHIIDIREPEEVHKASLKGTHCIPLGTLLRTLDNLPKDRELIILCHTGKRSLFATQLLRDHGFARVKSLYGGIEAWSKEIDASIPRY